MHRTSTLINPTETMEPTPAIVNKENVHLLTNKKWTIEEKSTLTSSLKDGVDLSVLEKLLPSRTSKAILRQVNYLGYGQKKDRVTKVIKLYEGKSKAVKPTIEDTTERMKKFTVTIEEYNNMVISAVTETLKMLLPIGSERERQLVTLK